MSLVEQIAKLLLKRGETAATAESCTGGLISAGFTALPGSSDWFKGGIVSYANEAKMRLLSVSEVTLKDCGAVSPECALEMVSGACEAVNTDWAVAVTGIAGPGGGSEEKPVGLVYISLKGPGCHLVTKNLFTGDRDEVRNATVNTAMQMLLEQLT